MIRLSTLACMLGVTGCTMNGEHTPRPRPEANSKHTLSASAPVHFANAVLFKPLEPKDQDILFTLAPLIILQVPTSNAPVQLSDGLAGPDSPDVATTNHHPVVHAWTDTVLLHQRPHPRVSYTWDHTPPPDPATRANSQQGVRITLGTNGQPMIWEVLHDTSGLELIVVSESLEELALKQFGPPLAGSRYSIESGTNNSPGVVVMRVIEDGPVPMGPIVYLSKETRNVATVICRCMPAQASNLVKTVNYQLVPNGAPLVSWPLDPLDRRLRLPPF